MSDILTFDIRPAELRDFPYIKATFAHTVGNGSKNLTWLARMHERIERLRIREATFIVAVDDKNADHILGWLCREYCWLHYIYVKDKFRRAGMARSLLAHAGLTSSPLWCTHWTKLADHIALSHKGQLMPVIP